MSEKNVFERFNSLEYDKFVYRDFISGGWVTVVSSSLWKIKKNHISLVMNTQIYLTWASVRPSLAANFRRSGFVMYFCIWNWISNPFRCNWLNTARDHDRFRFEFALLEMGPSITVMLAGCRCGDRVMCDLYEHVTLLLAADADDGVPGVVVLCSWCWWWYFA